MEIDLIISKEKENTEDTPLIEVYLKQKSPKKSVDPKTDVAKPVKPVEPKKQKSKKLKLVKNMKEPNKATLVSARDTLSGIKIVEPSITSLEAGLPELKCMSKEKV